MLKDFGLVALARELGDPWAQAWPGEPGGTALWTLYIKLNSKNPFEQNSVREKRNIYIHVCTYIDMSVHTYIYYIYIYI